METAGSPKVDNYLPVDTTSYRRSSESVTVVRTSNLALKGVHETFSTILSACFISLGHLFERHVLQFPVQMLRVAFSLFRSVRVSLFVLEETLKIQRSLIQVWGRGSVGGIAIRCGLENSGFETRWRQEEILPYPHTSRPALEQTHSALPWVPGQSPRDKATRAWP
jgi:hypothetical protein